MTRKELREAIEKIKDKWTFKEVFRNKTYFQTVKIWEKGDKFRVYVPRSAYEQAGYITLDENDVSKRNSGEKHDSATRPGNVEKLIEFIEDVLTSAEKTKQAEHKQTIGFNYPTEEV